MTHPSRIPGFYRRTLHERREAISARIDVGPDELAVLDSGGLSPDQADKTVENVLGTYALPFGLQLNVRVNGKDRLVPMVVEEPSVIAAASNAARIIRASGGFEARVDQAEMTAQVELDEVADPHASAARIAAHRDEVLHVAALAVPGLVRRGGGPKEIEVRDLGDGVLVVHLYVDCRDAMGANLVNSVAEAVGPRLAQLAGGRLGLKILTNLCDRRRVKVRCHAAPEDLALKDDPQSGEDVLDRIVRASRFAERDPYRAATHNKGVMNGIDAVVMATGNDYRAVEAGAHAWAASSGRYRPLALWRRSGQRLIGELDLPLSLGIVGGTLRVHRAARLALKIAGVRSADDLAMLAACAGLASNLAALRALSTEGIQRGHMSLHARSVALAAGATGDEVDAVAAQLARLPGHVTVDQASQVLRGLRGP